MDEKNGQDAVAGFVLRNATSIDKANFSRICPTDLGLLFHIIDEHSFEGALSAACEVKAQRPLSFRLSKRMTSSGGMTTMTSDGNRRDFEIAIATTPLFQTFQTEETIKVGGCPCRNRLEALQRIMEHEMIHLAEMLIWDDSNCAAGRFRGIASRLFGHTESNHQLMTPRDVARSRYRIRPGDMVRFRADGRLRTGFVNRITKRATVLVDDPKGVMYTDGRKYLKYYVPIEKLTRAA
ncbi:MAG: hypothetical protein AAF456_04935 [Planctomycetota bacterium]